MFIFHKPAHILPFRLRFIAKDTVTKRDFHNRLYYVKKTILLFIVFIELSAIQNTFLFLGIMKVSLTHFTNTFCRDEHV